MERIFADFTAQVFAFIRFDLSNQRHPRSISVKFGIAVSVYWNLTSFSRRSYN